MYAFYQVAKLQSQQRDEGVSSSSIVSHCGWSYAVTLSTPDWELQSALGVGDGGMRNAGSMDSSVGSVTREEAVARWATLPCTGSGGTRG